MQQKHESPFSHIQHAKKRAFLAAFAELGIVTRAARAARIDRCSHFLWKKADSEYAAAFALAQQISWDSLEDAAIERAKYGIDRPIFHQGKICGKVREYSDTLLIFALKGAMPDKYRERWSGELTGKDGAPLIPLSTVDRLLNDNLDGD